MDTELKYFIRAVVLDVYNKQELFKANPPPHFLKEVVLLLIFDHSCSYTGVYAVF